MIDLNTDYMQNRKLTEPKKGKMLGTLDTEQLEEMDDDGSDTASLLESDLSMMTDE